MSDFSNIPMDYENHGMTFSEFLSRIRLSVKDSYDFPAEVIKVNGVTIATIGNFSASSGKPKSKKTFNVSAIVAAALSHQKVLQYTVTLPPDKPRVLYVDTEQSRYHCLKVLTRILRMAGLPYNEDCDNLEFIVLREYEPEQRCKIINEALYNDHTIGLVVIDGLRDLLRDINNSTESVSLIQNLMSWSSRFDLHIHTVIHLNKADDNTRGHLGSELNNKAETVLQITKGGDNGSISEVKAMHIRDMEFQPFAFRINQAGLPELVGEYRMTKEKRLTVATIPEEVHREALASIFGDNEALGHKVLTKEMTRVYAEHDFQRGPTVINELRLFLIKIGAIRKEGKNYRFNASFAMDNLPSQVVSKKVWFGGRAYETKPNEVQYYRENLSRVQK